jgi:hypothetical protein
MLSRLLKDNEKKLANVKKRWLLFSKHQRRTCWRRDPAVQHILNVGTISRWTWFLRQKFQNPSTGN